MSNKTMSVRPPCVECVRKHLAIAIVLIQEYQDGYEGHDWLAMAHMDQAAQEMRGFDPTLSQMIREERKSFELDRTDLPAAWDLLIEVIGWTEQSESSQKEEPDGSEDNSRDELESK